MATEIFHGLHLTVTHDGTVSLWDTEKSALHQTDEVYLCLAMTPAQFEKIAIAQRNARDARIQRLHDDEPRIGQPLNLDGFEEVASIGGVSEESRNAKIVHNNSSHIHVVTQDIGGGEYWTLRATFPYIKTAYELAYAEALKVALVHVGAVIERQR